MKKFIYYLIKFILLIFSGIIFSILMGLFLTSNPVNIPSIVSKLLILITITTTTIMLIIFPEKIKKYLTYAVISILLVFQLKILTNIYMNNNIDYIFCFFFISLVTITIVYFRVINSYRDKNEDDSALLVMMGASQISIYMMISGYNYPTPEYLGEDKKFWLILIKWISNFAYLAIPLYFMQAIIPKHIHSGDKK